MKSLTRFRATLLVALAISFLATSCTSEQPDAYLPEEPQVEPDAPAMDPELAAALQRWEVTQESVGPIRFGMSVEEAVLAAGEELQLDEDVAGTQCVYGTVASMPPGMAVMVDEGVVARVDIGWESAVRSAANIGVGSTLAEGKTAYGDDGEVRENRYEMMQLEVLRPDEAGGGYGAIFEASEDTIYTWRAGLLSQVRWSEGCN
ncbi:hypothetical protein JYT20_00240 [Rhodothermus sp. AH-315-K08]|nr:hypothetical protein [Rhodothermus sp. AH-315-K08]